MKKKLFWVVLFICLFGFVDKINGMACIYEGFDHSNNNMRIQLGVGTATWGSSASPNLLGRLLTDMNRTNGNSHRSSGYGVPAGNLRMRNANNNGWTRLRYSTCTKYAYYYRRTGALGDQVFFTNSLNDPTTTQIFGQTFHVRLSLLGPYMETEFTAANVVPDRIICNYSGRTTYNVNSSVTFVIDDDGRGNGSFLLYHGFRRVYEARFNLNGVIDPSERNIFGGTTYDTNFNIRSFWCDPNIVNNPNHPSHGYCTRAGSYWCPETIFLGRSSLMHNPHNVMGGGLGSSIDYRIAYSGMERYTTAPSWFTSYFAGYTTGIFTLNRQNNSSLIEIENVRVNEGQLCNYTRDGENIAFSLMQYFENEVGQYINHMFLRDQVNADMSDLNRNANRAILTDCNGLPVVWSNCLVVSGTDCIISTTQFAGSERFWLFDEANRESAADVRREMGFISGITYKKLLCDLKPRLNRLGKLSALNNTDKLEIYDNEGNHSANYFAHEVPCNAWDLGSEFNCGPDCANYIDYEVENKIMEIARYCNMQYNRFSFWRNNESFIGRMRECISFDAFYASLVREGVIRNLNDNCGLSDDARGMINFFFDILMIAGPLIAIGLGIVDFAKAVVATDAAKEMKEAGGRFLKRIIAAILLLIIPLLLSLFMNIFLGNQPGFNPNNPFCGAEGWSSDDEARPPPPS